jgi:predicted RNA-binding Zn ribbon-like protein
MKQVNSVAANIHPQNDFVGGRLAIDFANTTRLFLTSGDALSSWGDLISFLVAVGNVSQPKAEALVELAGTAPDETAALFELTVDLRDAIRRSLRARVEGAELQPRWIAAVNSILACTEGYERLEPIAGAGDSEWRLRLAARSDGLEWLLASIARSAAELIAEGPGAPVRRCANPRCELYFYDDSRTGRRRWCSMATCGNRAKVAAHSRRKHAAR